MRASVCAYACVCAWACVCVCARGRVCACVCVCVRVCVLNVIVKRPALPPCAVDGRSRNLLVYYYYYNYNYYRDLAGAPSEQ